MNVLLVNGPGFDYMTAQICEGFHILDKRDGLVQFKCLNKTAHHGGQVDDLRTEDEENLLTLCTWADLIVYSRLPETDQQRRVFDDEIWAHKRVFIDWWDGDDFMCDPSRHLLYFKREYRIPKFNEARNFNIRSLSFSVFNFLVEDLKDPSFDWDNRDIDVSFMAFGGSNTARQQCADILPKLAGERGWELVCEVASDKQPVAIDEYREILRRSKIGISMPGAGFDTNRYWEIPGHGAVLSTFDLDGCMKVRNIFEHGRHCINFRNWSNMVDLCDAIVRDKRKWVRMRNAADRHVLTYHSTRARAYEIVQLAKEASYQTSSASL